MRLISELLDATTDADPRGAIRYSASSELALDLKRGEHELLLDDGGGMDIRIRTLPRLWSGTCLHPHRGADLRFLGPMVITEVPGALPGHGPRVYPVRTWPPVGVNHTQRPTTITSYWSALGGKPAFIWELTTAR